MSAPRLYKLYIARYPWDGGRTRTSRGGVLAAIGRSQVYTIDDSRGRVSDFKQIHSSDWHIFHDATLGAGAVKAVR